jgi:hypothetical protein
MKIQSLPDWFEKEGEQNASHSRKMGRNQAAAGISFTLINDYGIEVTCMNYGCIITKIIAS